MAANQLTEYLKGRKCQGFTPHPFHSKSGDYVTYYFKDEECHAERIDDVLTVFSSVKDQSCVGFKLKGIKLLREALGDFVVGVSDLAGKPMLGMFFMAGAIVCATPKVLPHYQWLAKETKSVPFEECPDDCAEFEPEPVGCG